MAGNLTITQVVLGQCGTNATYKSTTITGSGPYTWGFGYYIDDPSNPYGFGDFSVDLLATNVSPQGLTITPTGGYDDPVTVCVSNPSHFWPLGYKIVYYQNGSGVSFTRFQFISNPLLHSQVGCQPTTIDTAWDAPPALPSGTIFYTVVLQALSYTRSDIVYTSSGVASTVGGSHQFTGLLADNTFRAIVYWKRSFPPASNGSDAEGSSTWVAFNTCSGGGGGGTCVAPPTRPTSPAWNPNACTGTGTLTFYPAVESNPLNVATSYRIYDSLNNLIAAGSVSGTWMQTLMLSGMPVYTGFTVYLTAVSPCGESDRTRLVVPPDHTCPDPGADAACDCNWAEVDPCGNTDWSEVDPCATTTWAIQESC